MRKAGILSAAAFIHLILNYTFHFAIPVFKPVLAAIPLTDLLVVFLIEGIVIFSGILLIKTSLQCDRVREPHDSIRFYAGLSIACNTLFVAGLLYYGISAGWAALASSVYF
jgi:hypothetical protein